MHRQIKNLRRFLASFSLLLFAILTIPAQYASADSTTAASDSAAFQRFSDEDGLSQNSVMSILQDVKGFLWIGTLNGLNRFDGYQFVVYRHDFQDKNSLSDNEVYAVYKTSAGEIWVATANGLNKYEQATDDFRIYKSDADNPHSLADNSVRAIFEDRAGTLWVGTNKGLSRFDRAAESFTNYPTSSGVLRIAEDADGGLWMTTVQDGLNGFDRETGEFTPVQIDKNKPGGFRDPHRPLLVDRAGFVWVGAANGLHRFEPNSRQWKHFSADKNNPRGLKGSGVFSIYETVSGALWIGTGSGLNRYSRETDDFTGYQNDPTNGRSLSFDEILAIFEDQTGQLWLGTSINGVNKFNQQTSRFLQFKHNPKNPDSISNDDILAIFEDRAKTLWVGTRRGGLNRYDREKRRFEIVNGGFSKPVINIFQDREGKLWFGTEGDGLYFYENARFVKFSDSETLRQSIVNKIYQDRAGIVWLGTRGEGVYKLDKQAQKLTNYRNDPNNSDSLSENTIRAILEDNSGALWFGTWLGIDKFDRRAETFSHFRHQPGNNKTPSANRITALYEDKNGAFWIGTSLGGLNRFDRESGVFTFFTEREGLPNDQIYDIFEDEAGYLWMSTDKGLARFNPVTNVFRNFDVTDGLTHNEFNHKAAFKTGDGWMYFGGLHGFVRFHPRDFADSRFKPPVVLTDIRVLEQPLQTEQNVSELKELKLSWRDYVVSFDFAALDYTDPKKLQYQWKLDGFDENWINGAARRTATYTNLAGGEYVLKVRATNVDGVWSEESLNLKIIVMPPFYRTFWFFALVALAVAILIRLVYRSRINHLRAVSETQTKFSRQLIASQEAERKRIASELHDGLGQSLAIISNRAALGKGKKNEPEAVAREFEEISSAALGALDEVKEITGNLHPHYLERLGLTKALKSMFIKVSDVIELDCEIDSVDNLFPKEAEINVYRIIQESLNNVIKHSDASEAEIKIKKFASEVVITIKDDGRGFDLNNIKSKGGGLGLVGLRERTNMTGGRISITSSVGNGTEIKIILPVKNRLKQ